MFKPRPCGCKGIRTCLICESESGIFKVYDEKPAQDSYEYCYKCGKAWKGTDVVRFHEEGHQGESVEFPGTLVIPDFITEEEEQLLVQGCDSLDWDISQSGRRKQNFGPKTNFKKKKIQGKSFCGFPSFSKFAQDKLRKVDLLKDFQTIEQCAIEYRTETGACIDPHIDDCWVWGERVVSVNLISDSVLTMSKYVGPSSKYNLEYWEKSKEKKDANEVDTDNDCSIKYFVRIPMPARSLLVLYGAARYQWEHCIFRSDIKDRRICMAYREFTPMYLEGGELHSEVGIPILEKAHQFWDP